MTMENNDYFFVQSKMSSQEILLLNFTTKNKTILHYLDKEKKIKDT